MTANRMADEICAGCGAPLIVVNEFHMCDPCTEKIKGVIYKTKMRKRDKKSRTQKVIGRERRLHLTRDPLGERVDIA